MHEGKFIYIITHRKKASNWLRS